MIPGIREVNFPDYATLHQANISFADMGDKLITTQVKIDGDIAPEFIGTNGEDWEVIFKGERYIHPLRQPQATKNNDSRYSLIDMTFYHWAIYQMRRYYFVALANVSSGTPIADKYIVPMNLGLEDFAHAIDDILAYYFPNGEIYVYKSGGRYINPDLEDYDHQVKAIEINYTYIWELLQKTQELYDCHWSLEKDEHDNYMIKFGYPVAELTHVFEYGFNGGLLGIERQVQDANIRNQILGRGGEKNLPRLYFKDFEKFHPNSTDSAYSNYGQTPDPDAIPELENIYFSELRDSNFRSYVQGWKVNTSEHRITSTADGWSVTWNESGTVFTESDGTTYSLDSARLETDWAYRKGATDEYFDPVEYVKDDDSIETYGLLQGGLENQEDIFPTIQGMKVELPCDLGAHDSFSVNHDVATLADEIVDAEKVETDEISAEGSGILKLEDKDLEWSKTVQGTVTPVTVPYPSRKWIIGATSLISDSPFFTIPEGCRGYLPSVPKVSAHLRYIRSGSCRYASSGGGRDIPVEDETVDMDVEVFMTTYILCDSAGNAVPVAEVPPGVYFFRVMCVIPQVAIESRPTVNDGVPFATDVKSPQLTATVSAKFADYDFDGFVVDNSSAAASRTIPAGGTYTFVLTGSPFTTNETALMVEVPTSVTPKEFALTESTLRIIDTSTSEPVDNSNIPAGTYRTEVVLKVTNLDGNDSHSFYASLGPSFVYYTDETAQWQPTFDVWIKNIFNTDRTQFQGGEAGDTEYVASVWEPLFSSEEMMVTFATGNLSYSSDWEFKVASGGIHYDNSKTILVEDEDGVEHEVRSEWRLTLIKSEAETDSIHKYIPYKDYNAVAGDRFFFTNIYLPWAYVYAAERELNATKEDALDKMKQVQPTWVVHMDKVRIQQQLGSETDTLINSIGVGDHVTVHDDRFTPAAGVQLFISSITYNWAGEGQIVPEVEVVLSDKVETSLSTIQEIRSDVELVSRQLKGFAGIERTIRKIGDAVYLRRDGAEASSYSPTLFARPLQSVQFRSGVLGGEGWGLYTDSNGNAVIEADKLLVRKEMQVNNLVVNQVSAVGGKEILSAASMTISRVDSTEDGYICHFEQHGGTVANLFQVNDIAMSQVFDAANNQTKYYRRLVTGVGDDYIILSLDTADGTSTPQVGDVIVQYGNTTDTSRQFVIIRDVIGGGYERMLSGLNSVSAVGSEYYFAGIQSNSPRWFVGNHSGEYAEWVNGELTIRGKMEVRSGEGEVWTDISYLTGVLPKDTSTQITNAVVLSSFIGVRENNSIVAAINGSPAIQGFYDDNHGTLMFASGITNISLAKDNASSRIFADGTIITNKIVAQGGRISIFNIESGRIGVDKDDTGASGTGLSLYENFIGYKKMNIDSENKVQSRVMMGYNVLPAVGGIVCTQKIDIATQDYFESINGKAIGLQVSISGFAEPIAISCSKGIFEGLRPQTHVGIATSGTEVELNDMDYNVVVSDSSIRTVKLPQNPQNGQTYSIIKLVRSATSIVAQGSGIGIFDMTENTIAASADAEYIFVYHLTFCSKLTSTTYPNGHWILADYAH